MRASGEDQIDLRGRCPMAEKLLQFLLEHFTFLGFEFQYWMPVFAGVVAVYVLYIWRTANGDGSRSRFQSTM